MSYVLDNLLPGEKIKYEGKVHTFYFIIFFIGIIFGLLFFIGGINSGAWFIGLAIMLPFIYKILYIYFVEIFVTNKRVLYKTGIIARNVFELQLNKVESARLDQTIFQRIIGAGTLIVNGTGGDNKPIVLLSNPIEMKKKLYEAIDNNK